MGRVVSYRTEAGSGLEGKRGCSLGKAVEVGDWDPWAWRVFAVPVRCRFLADPGLHPAFCGPGVSACFRILGFFLFGGGIRSLIPRDATVRWGP